MIDLSRTQLIALAAGGSLAILLGAFGFQLIGYAPCEICLWQRWPHALCILLGVIALGLKVQGRWLPVLGGLSALTTSGLGVYHTGIERKWWAGPSSCTGGDSGLGSLSGADLLNFDVAEEIVMCDEVAWELFGLSMATYNAVAALAFAALWFIAARASR